MPIKKQTIKEAIDEIEDAVKSGDGGTIGQYLTDDRPKVKEAAEAALVVVSQSDAEDNTPVLETPEDAVNLNEAASKEKGEEEDEGPVFNGTMKRKDPEATIPVRPDEWVPITHDEVKKYQKWLVGHRPYDLKNNHPGKSLAGLALFKPGITLDDLKKGTIK